MSTPTQLRIPDGEITVDLFAGGGGGMMNLPPVLR